MGIYRLNDTKEARLQELNKKVERARREHEILEPYITDLLDNRLCKNWLTSMSLSWDYYGITLNIWDYDLPTVIDHVAGPFHRLHGVDWTLEVPWNGTLKLWTSIKIGSKAYEISIFIYEGAMRSCEFVRVPVRKKTPEEIKEALFTASDDKVYELRINCAEGEGA